MANDDARARRAPSEFWLYRQSTDERRGHLMGEPQILELISLGAPLAGILNRLCILVDVQIGDVVSLVSLWDEEENHLCSITQRALQVGLNVFSSTGIPSRDRTVLETLDIYACDPRPPAPHEFQLIEQASHLAAMALQSHVGEPDFERSSRRVRDEVSSAFEGLPFFIN